MSHVKKFQDQAHTHGRGQVAEIQAVEWLSRQGYHIVDRNVHTRVGEIDVVALDGETLCFIEIRARTSSLYGPAIASVTAAKQRKIVRAASLYLARRRKAVDRPCRFDVLGLDRGVSDPGSWDYSLIKNAFTAG